MFINAQKLCIKILITFLLVTSHSYVFAEEGDWIFRLRGVVISPDDSSSTVSNAGTAIAGTGVDADSNVVPELDITYMFHNNWGVELIAGISEHQVSFENSTGAAIAGLSDGQSLFDAWVLPPI
jgi:outer membrane protein